MILEIKLTYLVLIVFLIKGYNIFFCRYKASGVRLDSGDLAYLSIEARKVFRAIEEEFNIPDFGKMIITTSNDLNEETIDALNKQVIKLSHY